MDSFSEPLLPAYCQPTHPFLEHISRIFSTCIPTPASFLSSAFGLLSITAWLFAQLPQIYKNYQDGSAEGLSLLFLVNWLFGDITNLVGTVLLKQMFFQKFIAVYYVIVDLVLMAQWIWYGVFMQSRIKQGYVSLANGRNEGDENTIHGLSPPESRGEDGFVKGVGIKKEKKSMYDTSFPGTPSIESPAIGTPGSSKWNFGSGKNTVQTMFVFVTLFAFALAYPEGSKDSDTRRRIAVSTFMGPGVLVKSPNTSTSSFLTLEFIGGVIAWSSTILYCCSRIPQLLKNYYRRSCSGLSMTLFIAAFFGNSFYSLSLLMNPLAWEDYGPYGGGGLAGPEGSKASDWWRTSLPFFLGASGVLCQDAIVFCQFLLWGDKEPATLKEEGYGETTDDPSLSVVQGSLGSPWTRWVPSINVEVKMDKESSRLLSGTEEELGPNTLFEGNADTRTGYGAIP